jgi:hypothetical protein
MALTEAPLHLDHGGAVSRSYAVSDWPAAAWWGFWQPLLRLRDGNGRPVRVRIALLATPHPTSFWSREEAYRARRLRVEAEAQRRAGALWRAKEMEASASALEAAVLALVRHSPDLGERPLTRALAGAGATPGRVHRILERHGLLTAGTRRRWAEAAGAQAAPDDSPAAVAARAAENAGSGPEGAGAGAPAAAAGEVVLSALPPALLAVARDLVARLEPYFAGGLAHLFAAEDDVDFTAPLVVVHVADAAEADARLGALRMALHGATVREMLEAERRAGRRFTAVYFQALVLPLQLLLLPSQLRVPALRFPDPRPQCRDIPIGLCWRGGRSPAARGGAAPDRLLPLRPPAQHAPHHILSPVVPRWRATEYPV